MTGEIGKAEAASALDRIERAFAGRLRPAVLTDSRQLSDVQYAEVMSFDGLAWQDVTFAQAEARRTRSSGSRRRPSAITCRDCWRRGSRRTGGIPTPTTP